MHNTEAFYLDNYLQTEAGLSASGRALLQECIGYRDLTKGDYLLTEGSVCKKIYWVEKGYLRSFCLKDGKEINLDFSFEGDFVTNLRSIQSGLRSEYHIQAGEPTRVGEFDKNCLLQLYQQSPEIALWGRKLLEQLLIEQEEHANFYKMYTPIERYQYILKHRPGLLQRVSLSKLSSYLGISRETLSRIRKAK